jgi:tetratricopeptide (TPR) repeat protein
MTARSGQPARRPPRRRAILAAIVLALACAAAGAFVLLSRGRGTGTDPALAEPEVIPLESLPWPSVRPEAASTFQDARAEIGRAISLYASGDRDAADASIASALREIERAGALIPELGAYHFETVRTAAARRDFAEAERRAQRWLQKFPQDFDHLFFLGKARYQLRKWTQAAESFRASAQLHPESVEVLRWLGQTCAQMGAQEEAVQVVRASLDRIGYPREALWAHPLADQVLRNAITVLHRFQEYDLLVEVAQVVLRRHPDEAEAAMSGGVALANVGRYAEAEPLLRRSRADPSNAENADEIDFALALALGKQAKWTDDFAVLSALLDRNPFYSKGYYQLSLALVRLGRESDAASMIAKSRELAPSEREIRREKELRGAGQPGRAAAAASLGYALRGEVHRAEQVLRSPELRADPYAVIALADFYLDSLRVTDVEAVISHAATLIGADHQDILGHRALVARLRGDVEASYNGLRAAALKEGSETVWKLSFARMLLDDGKPDDAVAWLTPIRHSDADREASYLLARALLDRKDFGKGLAILRSVSTADTRWESWDGDAWLALALLEAPLAEGGSVEEASSLLEAIPPESRATRVYLRARSRLLERQGRPAAEQSAANESLQRYDATGAAIDAERRTIAASPWPESAPLHLALGRLHAGRGDLRQAVRHARLALETAPASVEAVRALVEWLKNDRDVYLRLKALRVLARLTPSDASVKAELQAIESRWVAAP